MAPLSTNFPNNMKLQLILKRAVMGAVLMVPALCMAWGAVAANADSGTHTSTGYGSANEAEQAAVKGCEKMGLPCYVLIEAANGGAFVVYVGKDGYHAAYARNPGEANNLAKVGCRKNYKGCELRTAAWDEGAVWLAVANSDGGSWVRYNITDPEEAQKQAMADCKGKSSAPNTCAIVGNDAHKGHVAIAASERAKLSYISVATGREAAAAGAMKGCAELPGKPDDCKVTQQVSNDESLPTPNAMKALAAQAEKNRAARLRVKASPPVQPTRSTSRTTEHYTCETTCNNASCVSRFGDGRIVRWTAQMKHDGFKWALDTSNCGR